MIVNKSTLLEPNVVYKIPPYGGKVKARAQNVKEKNILFMLAEWPTFKQKHGRDTRAFDRYCEGKELSEAEVYLQDLKDACTLTSTPLIYTTA